MAVNLSPVGGVAAQFFDNSGQVLTGGLLYTYLAGTTTPATTYTQSNGITAHPNPIVFNAAGRVPDSGEIWLSDGLLYKFALKDQYGVQIATYDNIDGINSNFISYTSQSEVQTATQGQTVFTLTTLQYVPATNNLAVYVNGSKQIDPTNYVETGATTVTFVSGLNVGDLVQFSTATPVAANVVDATNVSYNEGGTGAVNRNVKSKLQESVSVKDFGALGDGSTNDYSAIVAADASAASSNKALFFPSGTYISSGTITMLAQSWFGDSQETSILKKQTGASILSLVQVGSASGTSTKTYCSIENMKFDGNGGCSTSVLNLRNVQHSAFRFLKITNGSGNGLTTNTSTTSINTQILRNEYTSITSYSNTGAGFLFTGEKDTRYDNLFAHNNGSDGFKFKAFKDDGNNLAETTTCTITSLLSRDNGGNGFVFDMVEKYVAGALESTINGGAGFQFESTVTGATAYGSNSLICGSMLSRNDAAGAIRMSNTAYVYGLEIASLIAYGFNSTLNYPGIIIYGGSSIFFGNVLVQGFQGTAVYIQSGNPFGGGTAESNNIHFDLLKLIGNGNAAAAGNSGLVILNNSSDITVNNLISSNNNTNATTSEYELAVSATSGPINIGYAHLTAATAGYEVNIGLSETYITTYKRRSDTATLTLIDGVTAPSTNLANHAQIYIDLADGDLKIRFSDGTVKTIVTD